MTRASLAFIALMLAASPVSAEDRAITARSGVPVKATVYTNWNDDCSVLVGEVHVVSHPQHGSIRSSAVASRIGESRSRPGRTPHCTGKPVKGLLVTYRSQPGFRGRDAFTLNVIYGRGNRWIDRFVVDVR